MPATTLPKPNKWRNNRGAVTKKKSLRASLAIRTFKPEPFRPFLPNPHLQTILSTFFPKPPTVHYTRVTLPSDDDQAVLQIDIANGTSLEPQSHEILPDESTKPVFVIMHGLESSSTGVVTLRLVDALRPLDCKVVVLNYRSCAENEQFPKTLRLYHAGFTEDLTTLLRNIRQSAEKHNLKPPPIYLCGFSLGSNILCNFLGRLGQRAETEFNVVAAAGACVPFDVTACQAKIDSGWTGAVYSSYLVSTMRSKLRAAEAAGVDTSVLDVEKVMRADRIGSIDEEFISPVFGFKDRYDYYQQVDVRQHLQHITVPTFLLNSRDDPFFDHESGKSLPTSQQVGEAPILLNVVEHGGHCGFMDLDSLRMKKPFYFQREFARFFTHMRDSLDEDNDQQQP